jgi:hypothetical protein
MQDQIFEAGYPIKRRIEGAKKKIHIFFNPDIDVAK